MWTQNLMSVTVGNIVGGAIFVDLVYYFLYVHGEEMNNLLRFLLCSSKF